jgi:hypothetical protein
LPFYPFQITQNDSFSQYICNSCWFTVNDFHNFYCDIEKKHTNDYFLDQPAPHQFETKFLATESEIKSETLENELYFVEHNGLVKDDAIKVELIQKMSDDDDQCQTSANEGAILRFARKTMKKHSTIRKVKDENTEKDAATKAKHREIYEKCKKSTEWGEGQEKNIFEYCKMECFMCDEEIRFEKWRDMKRHYRSAHQMEGYVMCSCCNRKFVKRSKILDHVVRKQNPELFKCEICGKCLVNRDSFREHMVKHAPEESRAYKCTVCFKSFLRRGQFVEHQMHHLPDSEKKYACTECEMR